MSQQLQSNTTLQGGKFRIEQVLGQGGFGITYLAENEMLGIKVAIKEFFMKDYCSRDESTTHMTVGTESALEQVARFREKFLKEARSIARLHHRNIVRISDVFEENGTAYYVMDYCTGGSLSEVIKQHPSGLPEADALRYIRQVASSLEYIHNRKMNHLDVKPANILLDEDGNAILIDFGLAKHYDSDGLETTTTPVGISHGYAPLEQYSGITEFSPQSDVYSLGATLYSLLKGQKPERAGKKQQPLPQQISAATRRAVEAAMQVLEENRIKTIPEFLSILDSPCPSPDEEDTIRLDKLREEERKRQEAEAKRKAEEERKRQEAEAKRKAEEERKRQEAEAKRKAEEERKRKERNPEGKKSKSYIWILFTIVVCGLLAYCVLSGPETVVTNKTIVLTYGHSSKRNLVYSGEVDENGLPHGQGKGEYPETKSSSASVFSGTFVHGIMSDGELVFDSGMRFRGLFDSDGFYSEGTLWDKDGYYFKGTFKNGKPYNGTWYNPQGKEDSKVVNGE